jgi:hypothetical protein
LRRGHLKLRPRSILQAILLGGGEADCGLRGLWHALRHLLRVLLLQLALLLSPEDILVHSVVDVFLELQPVVCSDVGQAGVEVRRKCRPLIFRCRLQCHKLHFKHTVKSKKLDKIFKIYIYIERIIFSSYYDLMS